MASRKGEENEANLPIEIRPVLQHKRRAGAAHAVAAYGRPVCHPRASWDGWRSMKVYVTVHFDHTIDSDLSVAASIAKHFDRIETMIYAASALAESVTYGCEGGNEYYFLTAPALAAG